MYVLDGCLNVVSVNKTVSSDLVLLGILLVPRVEREPLCRIAQVISDLLLRRKQFPDHFTS
jgi:hypothetical protein